MEAIQYTVINRHDLSRYGSTRLRRIDIHVGKQFKTDWLEE